MPCGPKKQRKSMSTNKKLGKKYQYGGMLEGLLEGPSHEEGGIKFNVGEELQEAEGGEFVINKEAVESLGKENLAVANATGEWPETDSRTRKETTMSKNDGYPIYDAGGRVENIQGYGEGGKVKEKVSEVQKEDEVAIYYEDAKGNFTKEYPNVTSTRKVMEKDITGRAKKIVSGKEKKVRKKTVEEGHNVPKYRKENIQDIVRSVESKISKSKKRQKYIKEREE